ncbi:hypothetical protein [Roseivirga sp.]|uniref:hypothetical protein n=1 Tax=Roseivirga sp. TaxID=1964215 RepID=UPI003BAAC175
MDVKNDNYFQTGNIEDYQPIITALMKQSLNPNNTVSSPNLIAEVIYSSVIDGTNQLRYRAGNDANYLLNARKKMKEQSF